MVRPVSFSEEAIFMTARQQVSLCVNESISLVLFLDERLEDLPTHQQMS